MTELARSFDHRELGTPESEWLLPPLEQVSAPRAGERLVVVAAHPDDETLGAGGLLAAAHRNNAAITVVIATDGEGSHPDSPTHTPAQLATIRRREVQAAVALLAPDAAVHFLGLPDGGLSQHHDALIAQIEYFVRGSSRGATHLVSPWTHDRHPDHEACAHACAEVAGWYGSAHWQYPIWAWHWATSTDLPWSAMRSFSLAESDLAAKTRAIACHVSQDEPLSSAAGDEAILSPQMQAHFTRSSECFVVADDRDASSPAYFDALYARADDPWDLQGRFYEQRKRAIQLASLPRERFRRAFEPGCATGLLTAELAARCDEVVAWDVAGRALQQTAERVAHYESVRLARGRIPQDWPPGRFDLIVLSEVGYYCVDLDALVARVQSALDADGVVLACHWRHEAADHPHTAEAVHAALGAELHSVVHHVEDDFRLDVWSRATGSVASQDGILG